MWVSVWVQKKNECSGTVDRLVGRWQTDSLGVELLDYLLLAFNNFPRLLLLLLLLPLSFLLFLSTLSSSTSSLFFITRHSCSFFLVFFHFLRIISVFLPFIVIIYFLLYAICLRAASSAILIMYYLPLFCISGIIFSICFVSRVPSFENFLGIIS